MAKASIQDILHEIEALTDEERLALDQQLTDRLRQQWEHEAGAARDEAKRRGIDLAAIDEAIERTRYRR